MTVLFSCGHESKLQLLDGSSSSIANLIRYKMDVRNLCYKCWKKEEQKMTFEKEFPSLNGVETYFADTWTDAYFSDNAVSEHCLDKQRVKDAIPNIIKLFALLDDDGVWGMDTELFSNPNEAIKAVEKELGL